MTKRIISILLACAIFFALHGQEKFDYSKDFKTILAKTKDPASNLFYDKLLKRFKDDDTTLTGPEVLSLMIGFTDKPAYKPYDVIVTEQLIGQLNSEGKYKAAYDTATAFIKSYPLSFQALYQMIYSLEKLGKEDSAAYYVHLVARVILGSAYSGDGKSAETAMFVLGPKDGQSLLELEGFGIGTMGSGVDKSGNFLDILQGIKDGDQTNFYFNIQHAALKMFGGKSAEEIMKELKVKPKKSKKKNGL
jgi:hypothetical protein